MTYPGRQIFSLALLTLFSWKVGFISATEETSRYMSRSFPKSDEDNSHAITKDEISHPVDNIEPSNQGEQQRRRLAVRARRTTLGRKWRRRLKKGETLQDIFNCVGNPDPSRWRHEEPLYRNQYLCSKIDNFIFGLTKRGDLIWVDVKTAQTKYYFKTTPSMRRSRTAPEYFQLSRHGDLQLYDKSGAIVWEEPPKYDGIDVNTRCLTDYDCPYLHLHDVKGKNVLNFIDPNTSSWIANGIDRAYNF